MPWQFLSSFSLCATAPVRLFLTVQLPPWTNRERTPPDGEKIKLPRAPTAVRALRIQVEGIVIRVDQREEGKSTNGFAVANQKSVLSDRP